MAVPPKILGSCARTEVPSRVKGMWKMQDERELKKRKKKYQRGKGRKRRGRGGRSSSSGSSSSRRRRRRSLGGKFSIHFATCDRQRTSSFPPPLSLPFFLSSKTFETVVFPAQLVAS